MKHETKSLLIFAGLFVVAGYIYEKYISTTPSGAAQAQVTQLQAQAAAGYAANPVQVTPAPIQQTLVEYTGN